MNKAVTSEPTLSQMLTSAATAFLAEVAGKLHIPVEIKVGRNMCLVVANEQQLSSLRLSAPPPLLYRGGEGRRMPKDYLC